MPEGLNLIEGKVGIPGDSLVKNLPASGGETRDTSLIPRLGRPSEGGNGNPFQYSSLENSMNKRAWRATAYKMAKSQT